MIYDCFPFFNELDILEIRLNTLDNVVDRFVIAESAWTHTGQAKPFYFEENKKHFSRFLHKIIHIKLTDLPKPPTGGSDAEEKWFLENFQRNALVQGLSSANEDDIIILSDCDEIPNPIKIREYLPRATQLGVVVRFFLNHYNFYLNLRDYTQNFWTAGSQMCSVATFRNSKTFDNFQFSPCVAKRYNSDGTLTQLRFKKSNRIVRHAGWHFSYVGSATHIVKKMHAIADSNFSYAKPASVLEVQNRLSHGNDATGRGHRMIAEPIQNGFPPCISEARFRNLIMVTDNRTFRKSLFRRLYLNTIGILRDLYARHLNHHLWHIKHHILHIH